MNVSKVKLTCKYSGKNEHRGFSAPFCISARHDSLEHIRIVDKVTKLPNINVPSQDSKCYSSTLADRNNGEFEKKCFWDKCAANYNITYFFQQIHETPEDNLQNMICNKNDIQNRREKKTKQCANMLTIHGEGCLREVTDLHKMPPLNGVTDGKNTKLSKKLFKNPSRHCDSINVSPLMKSPLLPSVISPVTRNLLTRYLDLECYAKEQQTNKIHWGLRK